MATYNKKDMSETKPDIFKSRTKEWDANEWQGRSKANVEASYKFAFISIIGMILTLAIAAIIG